MEDRRGGLGDVEAVGRSAVLVELGRRQRRGQLGELHQRVVDTVGQQLTVQQRAETVA